MYEFVVLSWPYLVMAVLYLEVGRMKWHYILLTEARTNDARNLMLAERGGNWALLIIKWAFIALWPAMLSSMRLWNLAKERPWSGWLATRCNGKFRQKS